MRRYDRAFYSPGTAPASPTGLRQLAPRFDPPTDADANGNTPTATPSAANATDVAAIARAVTEAIGGDMDARIQRGLAAAGVGERVEGNGPVLNAQGETPDGAETAAQRALDGGRQATPEEEAAAVRTIPLEEIPFFNAEDYAVEEDPRRRAFLGYHLFRMFHGQAQRDFRQVDDAVNHLAQRGFYGDEARQRVANGQRALSTLTDSDGAVFIPEVVYNEVLRIVPEYGVIRRLARVIPNVDGPIRIPNLASGLVAFWVGEGQLIKARKPAFGKVLLDPEKMGLIVPWTTEVREEVGANLLNLIVTLIAEAFGKLEDQTFLYGDGTAAYGGITGLANTAGVNTYVLGGAANSGANSFGALTYDHLIAARAAVPAPVRKMGTWILHPDSETVLLGIKDNQDRPVFEAAYREGDMDRLLGRPVEWVQAAHANADSAANKPVGFYGDFSKYVIAQGRGMTSKLMTEATIKDVDDNTDIYLGAQDMEALRCTQRLDALAALPAAFVKILTSTT